MFTLLTILIFLAAFHFVYEAIIVPSARLALRFKLFALRDQLRNLKIVHGDRLDGEVFEYLQGSINNTIRILHRIDIATILRLDRTLNKNTGLRRQVEKRTEVLHTQLENCPIEEARKIHKKNVSIFLQALLINNGGLFLYILPFVLVVVISVLVSSHANRQIESFERIVHIPENQMDRLMPAEALARA